MDEYIQYYFQVQILFCKVFSTFFKSQYLDSQVSTNLRILREPNK